MAKTRKTRAQKLAADKRRPVSPVSSSSEMMTVPAHTSASPVSYTFSSQTPPSQPVRSTVITTHNYEFLVHDLRKTILLTLSIIVAQLVIFYLTHR